MVYHRVARDPKSDEVALEAHGDAVTLEAHGLSAVPAQADETEKVSPVRSIAKGKACAPHEFSNAVLLRWSHTGDTR